MASAEPMGPHDAEAAAAWLASLPSLQVWAIGCLLDDRTPEGAVWAALVDAEQRRRVPDGNLLATMPTEDVLTLLAWVDTWAAVDDGAYPRATEVREALATLVGTHMDHRLGLS